MRSFNTAGPCVEGRHYIIEPLSRLPGAQTLVEDGKYFVVHAPRQSGKTTFLIALAQKLNAEGKVAAVYFNGEAAKVAGDDFGHVEQILIERIRREAETQLPVDLRPPTPEPAPDGVRLGHFLTAWARACPKPVALLFDEIDSLTGLGLQTALRQLRTGYANRPAHFPASVVLCGMKDVRDYQAASGIDESRLGTASPFNVKVVSARIGDFDEVEVNTLLDQHTADTGQVFTREARARIFAYTQGQPWLTNALARELVEVMGVTGNITAEQVDRAKERLIVARATHLDSLVKRLEEPRVRRILGPLISGQVIPYDPTFDDDLTYVRDLGLIAPSMPVHAANPIYREVITRVLGQNIEASLTLPPRPTFVGPDGRLDIDRLLNEFLIFWKRHGEALSKRETYHEIAAQLVLMAFLQRVVNGGGYVEREYAIGKGAIDLLIRWPLPGGGWQQEAFELKTRRPKEADPLEEGLAQLDAYLDGLSLETGVLAIFDRRPRAPAIAARSGMGEAVTPKGRTIRVLRG